MVLNVHAEQFDLLKRYQLEAEVYSLDQLQKLALYTEQRNEIQRIHIKLNTGMNRLGFDNSQIQKLTKVLKKANQIEVASVFTHLASTDDANDDPYTHDQVDNFARTAEKISMDATRHVLNSAGTVRFPLYQFEMVRLGIGLYGIDPSQTIQNQLETVATFSCQIAQIKQHLAGTTIGYNRKGILKKDSIIATLKIGYADGIPRILGNNKGHVLVQNKLAPIVGNVCMDMIMIDVSDIPCKVGDTVELFGPNRPIQDFAKEADTIAYDVLTNIGNRVKRVFFQE